MRNENSAGNSDAADRLEAKRKRQELREQLLSELPNRRRDQPLYNQVDRAAIVEDIKRLAESPDNPFPGTCSFARYRELGWYPERAVRWHFGNFTEAQRDAGLREPRTTQAYHAKQARIVTESKIAQYFKEEITPWIGRFETDSTQRFKWMVIGSDFHGEGVCPFTLSVFLDVCKRVQPTYIALNGDVPDFAPVGRWTQNPHMLNNLQREIDYVEQSILAPTRAVAPNAQMDWIIGNHEYWLIRLLADNPGLASLRCLKFSNLFNLEKHRIQMVMNRYYEAPDAKAKKELTEKNWRIYDDTFVVTHGHGKGTNNPGVALLNTYGMAGTSGHTHRPNMVTKATLRSRHADWVVTGCMARHEVGDPYVVDPTDWTKGFNVVLLDTQKKVALQQPVLVKDGVATFAGKIYEAK